VEGAIHGIAPHEVHFHEVGAVDAIVDIVGTIVGFELLGIERAYHSAPPLGSGTTRSAHGVIPIPAPATIALLRGRPARVTELPFEQTTPTGALLLAALAEPGPPPLLRAETIGYGCGQRDPAEVANLLRLVIGEAETALGDEELLIVETNVDDMSPQAYEPLFEKMFAAGALDFFVTPVVMKKGRPAHLLTALAPPSAQQAVTRVLLVETPTLGVRVRPTRRVSLPREERVVQTEWGPVRVKVAFLDGRAIRTRPEYEDCRRLAAEHQLPFLDVYEAALRAAR
jgi:uncharacterized protein (TIGR00299 family) protein